MCELNQTLRIRVTGLEDNFSSPYGPQSCLKNKKGALASPEPLSGPRSANAIKPFTWRHNGYVGVNASFFRNKFEQLSTRWVKTLYMEIRYEKRLNKIPDIIQKAGRCSNSFFSVSLIISARLIDWLIDFIVLTVSIVFHCVDLRKNNIMSDPLFCFLKSPDVSLDFVSGNIITRGKTKLTGFPRDLTLSILLYF